MKFDNMAFPQEFLWAALLVSLLSVWLLTGLFHQLNRASKKDYHSIWTGAWLFYAVWMTLSLGTGDAAPGTVLFAIDQFCVSISAALLLWGCMRYLGMPVPKRLSTILAIFLSVWILTAPSLMTDPLAVRFPAFVLLGLSTPFASICFLRFQTKKESVGLGTLSLGFLLWVIYIGSYPLPAQYGILYSFGFFMAAALQLFIAISMIVLLFREAQTETQEARAQVEAARLEKEALKSKVIDTKEECQVLYNRMRAKEDETTQFFERSKVEKARAEREQLRALGQMTSDVVHDINNALSPITAYSELLLDSLSDLPDVPRQRLQRINQAAEEVAQIVAHMREFYRPETDPRHAGAHQPNATGQQSRLDPDLPCSNEHCRPLRILCIDDEPDLTQVIQDVLEAEGHEITTATGGMEGVELFKSSLRDGEPYEVVITDLGMPEVDGHNVARAIKAQSPNTPVIMLTGWGSMPEKDGLPPREIDAVISKPPRKQELSSLLFQITARTAMN
jgi:CheY-like chemotaxis protein